MSQQSTIEYPARIQHSGDSLDALSCNFYSLAKELEFIKDHTIDQHILINDCLKLVKHDAVLENKISSILECTQCIINHVIKQDEILYSCGIELGETRLLRDLDSTIENSEEYKQFQEDCDLVKSNIDNIKSLLAEQSQLLSSFEAIKSIKLNVDSDLKDLDFDETNSTGKSSMEDFMKFIEVNNNILKNLEPNKRETNKIEYDSKEEKENLNGSQKFMDNKISHSELDQFMKKYKHIRSRKLQLQKGITHYCSF